MLEWYRGIDGSPKPNRNIIQAQSTPKAGREVLNYAFFVVCFALAYFLLPDFHHKNGIMKQINKSETQKKTANQRENETRIGPTPSKT